MIKFKKGFLLEQKLATLLKPLEKNEQSMIKLDSIFKALKIETENDVKLLAQYFINHRQYRDLIKNKTFVQSKLSNKTETGVGPSPGSEYELHSQQMNDEDAKQKPTKTVPHDSIELIHPNEVVNALKNFVYIHRKSESKPKLSKFRLKNLDNRDDSTDQEYWKKYENVIDSKKEKVWDAMLYALQKYQ